MIGHVTSILVDLDSRRLACARVNASPGPLLTFVNRSDDIARIGLSANKIEAYERGGDETRRASVGRSAGRSIDRPIDRCSIELGTCGPARERNPRPACPKDPLAISQRSCPSTCQRRNNAIARIEIDFCASLL